LVCDSKKPQFILLVAIAERVWDELMALMVAECSRDQARKTKSSRISHGRNRRYVVGSGNLPPAVSSDFYGRVAKRVKTLGARLIVDTSGDALRQAGCSGIYLLKPNLRELQQLLGYEIKDKSQQERASRELVGSVTGSARRKLDRSCLPPIERQATTRTVFDFCPSVAPSAPLSARGLRLPILDAIAASRP